MHGFYHWFISDSLICVSRNPKTSKENPWVEFLEISQDLAGAWPQDSQWQEWNLDTPKLLAGFQKNPENAMKITYCMLMDRVVQKIILSRRGMQCMQ